MINQCWNGNNEYHTLICWFNTELKGWVNASHFVIAFRTAGHIIVYCAISSESLFIINFLWLKVGLKLMAIDISEIMELENLKLVMKNLVVSKIIYLILLNSIFLYQLKDPACNINLSLV